MKKKRLFLICTSLVMAMLLAFAIGCGKDDDNNNDNNDDNNEFAPLLSTTEVTDISFTYATSGGNITDDRGFTVTAKGVCWSTNQSPTTKDNKTEDGTGAGIFASKLTGLAAGATYYVRAYASNSKGTGYGSTLSLTALISESGPSLTDARDGNVYKTVKIGNQVWMAENLKYLPGVLGSGTGSYTNPHYYVYGYEGTNVSAAKATTNYSTYGVLYNWPAAKNACPTGWHLPSDAEWTQLTDYLGGRDVAGGKMKETGTKHWNSPNTGATNESGFTGLPGGLRDYGLGNFYYVGRYGYWWSSSETSTYSAWYRGLDYYGGTALRSASNKAYGLSVRCLRD